MFTVFALYFLFPANLLIYGVNDVYDYETDRLNPKKQGYEGLLEPSQHAYVLRRVLFWNLPFVLALPFIPIQAVYTLGLFVWCAVFYSAPPIRAKARPFWDSLFSAGHYVATGVFGYLLASSVVSPDWVVVGAALAWCIAMHAYSAVPDIRADTDARLSTIATKLGGNRTIVLCALLYIISAVASFPYLGWVSVVAGVMYVVLMALSYGREDQSLMRLYRLFPLLNAIVGGCITIILLFR